MEYRIVGQYSQSYFRMFERRDWIILTEILSEKLEYPISEVVYHNAFVFIKPTYVYAFLNQHKLLGQHAPS